jgi:hypothetical protein
MTLHLSQTNGSFENHLTQLDEILQRLKENNLQVKWRQVLLFCNWSWVPWICTYPTRSQTSNQKSRSNCQDCYTQNSQESPLLHWHDQLLQGPYPTWFRLTHTTYRTTKKGAQFKWMDNCQHSFDKLKRLFTKQTVLAYPDFTIPFEIYTDASNKQIGSAIQQSGRPLAFYSRKLTNAQTHYTVIKLELLAIVKTLQEYCTILLGHIIKIYTDHKNLTFANFNTDCECHWQLIVEEYGPEIVYLPGVKNIVANFLSCHPISTNSINEIH